jgi:hypothetical protein
MRFAWSVGLLASSFVLLSCKPTTYHLTDTEGRTFEATCSEPIWCAVTSPLTPAPTGTAPPGSHAGFAVGCLGHRYECVGDAWISDHSIAGGGPEECRILTCTTNDDCPTRPCGSKPACLAGLCTDAMVPLDEPEVERLCLAGTGPWTNSVVQQKRLAAARAACGPNGNGTCKVPPECHQPG